MACFLPHAGLAGEPQPSEDLADRPGRSGSGGEPQVRLRPCAPLRGERCHALAGHVSGDDPDSLPEAALAGDRSGTSRGMMGLFPAACGTGR